MSRSLLLVFLLISISLSACASARAEGPIRKVIQGQTSTDVEVPQKSVPNPKRSSSPTADVPELAAFESSVLVAEGGGEIETVLYPIDPSSGRALNGYQAIPLGLHYSHAFSPDKRRLALATFLSSKYPYPHSLVTLDLATWREDVYDLGLDSYLRGIVFSPDGRRLAVLSGEQRGIVTVFDRDREAITAQSELDFLATRIKFTNDGRSLMLYGTARGNSYPIDETVVAPPTVILLDADDLSPRWKAGLEGVRDGIYLNDGIAESVAD